MSMQWSRPSWVLAVGVVGAVVLAACGGTGEADPGVVVPETAPSIVITQANANRVAAEALQAMAANLSSAASTSGGGGTAAAAGIASKVVVTRALAQAAGMTAQAVSSQRVNCPNGGTATITLTLAGASLVVGDSLKFVFAACKEGDTVTNGTLDLKLAGIDFEAAGGTRQIYDAVVTNLDQTVAQVTERMNGSVRLEFDDRLVAPRIVGQLDTTATSNVFTIERRVNGVARSTREIQNLVVTRSDVVKVNRSSSFVLFTGNGNFPQLNQGAFRFDTITAIVTPAGGFIPTSGEVQITGANGTNIIVRIGADTVKLEIDTDGDKVANFNVERSWQQVIADL